MAKPLPSVFNVGLHSRVALRRLQSLTAALVLLASGASTATAQPQAIPAQPQATPAQPQAIPAQPQATPAQPQATPAQPQAAPPNASVPDWHALLAGQRDSLGRSCELKAIAASGALRYLACGAAGVWVVRAEPGQALAVLERYELDGSVTGFFVRDGHLWAQIETVHARQLAQVDAATTSAAPPAPLKVPPMFVHTPRLPAPRRVPIAPPSVAAIARSARFGDGRVIERGPGFVVINIGMDEGAREDAHIAFYEQTRLPVGPGVTMLKRSLVAVGRVESATPERARVVLGLNERVAPDASARTTHDPLTATSIAPPRVGGVWDVAFLARPFLVLKNLGAGVFGDLRAGYRDASAGHYEVMLQPFALATADRGGVTPFATVVAASYDARLFEVGLGFGGQTVNLAASDLDPGTGLTLLQRVRLGARDGLHVEALSYVALFHSEFEFSGARVTTQIPLTRGTWLLGGGGGGSLGLGYGEIGLRMLLSGNGDRDSFFLTTTVGGVHVFESNRCFNEFGIIAVPFECRDIDYAGPMVGAGGEWRF